MTLSFLILGDTANGIAAFRGSSTATILSHMDIQTIKYKMLAKALDTQTIKYETLVK